MGTECRPQSGGSGGARDERGTEADFQEARRP